MSYESLIQELTAAQSSEEKAAIVANAVIQDLPPKLARVAIGCSFMPWFSTDLINGLLGSESNDNALQSIINLPFVETIPLGYCFHSSTHRGLLQKYKSENPAEIVSVFETFQEQLSIFSDTKVQSLIVSLYGYVITNQGLKAEELLFSLVEQGKIQQSDALSLLDEAEEFCLSDGVGLTSNYWFYRGNLFLISKDFRSAIKYCDKALELDKNYYRAYSIRSVAQAHMGKFDDAFGDINKAVQAQPDELLYRSRASIYLLHKDYKNSIFDFTRALRINPKDIQAYLGRSNAYLLSKKEEQAFHDLDSALLLSNSNDTKFKSLAYIMYAQALAQKKEFQKALALYTELVKTEPTSGSYRRMGNILFKLGKFEEAKESYRQSLELDDQNPYAYLGRGKLYLSESNYKRSILDFEKALDTKKELFLLQSNSLDIKEANLRLWEAYIKLGNLEEAEKQKKVLINTTNETELYEILYFCRKYRLFEIMLQVGEKLIKTPKVTALTYVAIGYALNQLEDYEGALNYFEKEEVSRYSKIVQKINIGVSYWGLNEYEKAKESFRAANKELNKTTKDKKFNPIQNGSRNDFSERVWLKVMLGNSKSALQYVSEHLRTNNISNGNFYDLRDWGLIVKRSPAHLPAGFDEFYDHISKVLIDIDRNSIYELASGI